MIDRLRRLFRQPTDEELRERERQTALEARAAVRRIEAAAAKIEARGGGRDFAQPS